MNTALAIRLAAIRSGMGQLAPITLEGAPRFILFFSCSDRKSRATVLTVVDWLKAGASAPDQPVATGVSVNRA